MSDLLWQSVCPWPLLLLALALVASGILWSLFAGIQSRTRRMVIGSLRGVMLALFLILLLQPRQRHDEVTVLRPQLALLVDGSESMRDPADPKQLMRMQRAIEFFHSKSVEQAAQDFDLRVFRFDRNLSEQSRNTGDWSFNGANSFLFEAVNHVQEQFRGQPLAGILLLSDGLDTSSSGAETLATNVPVFSFELEKPFARRELQPRISLAGVDYPPKVVVGWDTQIRVSVAGTGMSGKTASVGLWREGNLQAEIPVSFNEDEQTRTISFAVAHEKPGTVKYEIRVNDPAADREARSYPFVIEAMESGNRVIYLQNSLGFDFKFLRKAIVSNRNLQLSTFVRWSDGRIAMMDKSGAEADAGVDFSPKSLANSAVVILGDLAPAALSAANASALRDFVDQGGALVLMGGPNLFTSRELSSGLLGALLPITLPAPYQEGKFPVKITETGLHHPVFGPLFEKVGDFPALLTCNSAATVSRTAEVLMQVNNGGTLQPLIVAARFGKGRVVAILSDTMWRWRLASRGWDAEHSPYDIFWTQLMDWLISKEQEKQLGNRLELFTKRANYNSGEHPEVCAILSISDPSAKPPPTLQLQIRTPDEKVFDYLLRSAILQTPGGKPINGYKAIIDADSAGVYVAKSSIVADGDETAGETRFVMSKPATEITGKPINREALKRIAEMTGEKFYTIQNWDAWRKDLHFKEQHFSRLRMRVLWNHPALLGLLLLLLIAEWLIRKSWNLP